MLVNKHPVYNGISVYIYNNIIVNKIPLAVGEMPTWSPAEIRTAGH